MQDQPQVLRTYGFLNFLLQGYERDQATFLLIYSSFAPDISLFYLFIYLFIYIYIFIYLFIYLFIYSGTSNSGHFRRPTLVAVALEVTVVGRFYYRYIFY